MVSNRHLTWRVENIPSQFDETRLKSCFHSDDKKYIEIKSLVPDANNYDGCGTKTATILFSSPEAQEPRIEENDDLTICKIFMGFTPLNTPSDDVCADIIAITGLAGHAFGSWAHSAEKMWLRDYLPRDIQNRARILIYGYESATFVQKLVDIREHQSCKDRPLILIGHSLGGLIIKQAITDLDPSIRSRLPIRTVLFFGAPHNGLEISALETLVKGRPTETLISELKRESPTLAALSLKFRQAAQDLSIHSYFESRATKTLIQGPDRSWQCGGEKRVMVERSSALQHMSRSGTYAQVDGDHKEIARIKQGHGGVYPNVLRIVKTALQSASEQYTALRLAKEKQPETTATDQNDAQKDDEDDKDQKSEGYDDENLLCDACYDQFLKSMTHYHCYICDDGDFNICRSCKKSGRSCLGGHDMLKRQLGDSKSVGNESDDEDSEIDDEEDEDENILTCDGCDKDFRKDDVHFHCVICEDGFYDLCRRCRKNGRVCPGRHKMLKRKLAITEESPPPDVPSTDLPTPDEDNSPTQYCDIPDCHCDLPKRVKNKARSKNGWNDMRTCRVCRDSFNSRNQLFDHLRAEDHMAD